MIYTAEELAPLRSKYAHASDSEFSAFIRRCQAVNLDPFAGQIYLAVRYNGDSINYDAEVTIVGLRLIAQRTGEYAGQQGPLWCGDDGHWRDVWLSDAPPAAAKVGILRKGFDEPVWGVARYASFAVENSPSWENMADLMLSKCAEAQGLRKAFPMETSGLYISDEMMQAAIPAASIAACHDNQPTEPMQILSKDDARRSEQEA